MPSRGFETHTGHLLDNVAFQLREPSEDAGGVLLGRLAHLMLSKSIKMPADNVRVGRPQPAAARWVHCVLPPLYDE